MNIYNVVLMSVTVVALSNILNDRPTLSYAVVSALIWFSTTSMLCLLFLPKVGHSHSHRPPSCAAQLLSTRRQHA